ncbi:MAG: hypothetical protein E7672_02355 [Ruminococcaceae bacterium]|nr:hypothetical protein [Oscillospiraceae bacterium]
MIYVTINTVSSKADPRGSFMTNNKKIITLLTIFFITITLVSCVKSDYDLTNPELNSDGGSTQLRGIINPDSEVRGVWIASVFNIDYPSRSDLSADLLKAEIDAILDTCEANELNTVFFQVRPSCDALYDSDIFPVSRSLSSSGSLVFDPLEYIVSEGHQRNIFVHAWVNPLRVTTNSHDISALPEGSPAKNNPEWVVAHPDGKLYLNAGIPAVQQLVVDGVREIVEKYDVDGVVFDDYFYPYPTYDENGALVDFADEEQFDLYGSGYSSKADWRRDNINKIIKGVYDAVHETDSECVFGVSPFAIWQNNDGENGGSDTKGLEAYKTLYCDATAWIEGGYIDYLSPQIYWTFSDKMSPFDILLRWWNTQLDGSDVKLYVSHASYRYEEGEWDSPEGQLSEQVTFARSEKTYRGSIFYGYDEIKRNIKGASDELKLSFKDEIIYSDIQSNGMPVSIASPANGSVTYDESTYIIGSCDPYYSLTLNGKKVNLTKSGYFSLYVDLELGENEFVFEQNGVTYTYKITRKAASSIGTVPTEPEIPILNSVSMTKTYPTHDVATSDGKVWVSCTVPYGTYVEVSIGGIVTPLQLTKAPAVTWSQYGYVGAEYGAYAAIPEASGGDIIDCGNINFTAYYGNHTMKEVGPAVRSLGEDSVICVRANEDYTHLKISESSLYYNDYTVQSAGMTDYAVAQRDGFYLLQMGGYIAEGDVTELTLSESTKELPQKIGKITSAIVKNATDSTDFVIETQNRPPYNACIENDRFVVTFYSVDAESAPECRIAENPIVKSCQVIRLDTKVRYSFELYSVENFYGFDLEYRDNGTAAVTMRNPMKLSSDPNKPLSGIDIVLDAGHGGSDPGAVGVFKSNSVTMHEKDINLAIVKLAAERLTELGADITLIRDSDETVDLYSRMYYLEDHEPDLFISIHQNSMGYLADITRIRGTLALWCMDSGVMLSDVLGRNIADSLGRHYLGSQYQMLAVCRNPKFPSALIEVGFITSVEEYEQMLSAGGIEKAADGVCRGVLEYFARQAKYLK